MIPKGMKFKAGSAAVLAILLFVAVMTPSIAFASGKAEKRQAKSCSEQFGPLRESKAFQQFRTRPVTDLSKLFYLIDRFSGTPIEIVFNGHYYKTAFVAQLAKFFLAQNYKKETPKQWIMKWCNVSPQGTLIWVKFPDNSFKLSRDVLLSELEELEKALMADVAIPPAQTVAVQQPENKPETLHLGDKAASISAPLAGPDAKKKLEPAPLAS